MQAAGVEALALKKDDECTEIMTGAVLSRGADCIVPVEEIRIENDAAIVNDNLKLKRLINVRPKGVDHREGTLLLSKGSVLGPAQIATAAAVGKATLKVNYRPKVAVISTGDELVDVDAEGIEPFQVRKSNSYFCRCALDQTRLFRSSTFHFRDNKKVLLRQISAIMEEFDVLVITGGISMGKFDFIPEVMRVLNVDIIFQRVKQKPGKPFWYGRTKRNQPVFALPGNPLATQIGLYRHVIPNLKLALGAQAEKVQVARLAGEFEKDTPFAFFLLVNAQSNKEGELVAEPVMTGGSGDVASAAAADGFIELPASPQKFPKGYCAPFYRF
jgi:molybdopterin molybdotransferase